MFDDHPQISLCWPDGCQAAVFDDGWTLILPDGSRVEGKATCLDWASIAARTAHDQWVNERQRRSTVGLRTGEYI